MDYIKIDMEYSIKVDGKTVFENNKLELKKVKNEKSKIPNNIEDIKNLQYLEE